MLDDVKQLLQQCVADLYGLDVEPHVSIPEEKFGDVASNVAMQIAKKMGRNPREIAQEMVDVLSNTYAQVSVAGPGFLNIRVSDIDLWGMSTSYNEADFSLPATVYSNKRVVLEYSCPNWFKELHTGHLYQTILGNALARMLEVSGAQVHRTTFGGDVGMHVAKALWSILQDSDGYEAAKVSNSPLEQAAYISKHYVKGSAAFEEGGEDQKDIKELNKKIYEITKDGQIHEDIAEVYTTCREWSTQYFHVLYDLIQVDEFEKYYPESTTEERGTQMVITGLEEGVFEESDGAAVYRGEKVGLHTRVFRTREGLPTYETKDLGVITQEKDDFNFEYRILITGADQKSYMQVVWAALYEMDPHYRGTMIHIMNGLVKFGDGVKMSSRLGNVARAIDVIEAVGAVIETQAESREKDFVVLGAIKYEFLKYGVGGDISFDIEESVSTKGNSGPYLQYAYVRARRILDSAQRSNLDINHVELDQFERKLVRKLSFYTDMFSDAVRTLAPNTLCLYLYELAQVFNQFYENSRVIGDERQDLRIELVKRYAFVLSHGLNALGIALPSKM